MYICVYMYDKCDVMKLKIAEGTQLQKMYLNKNDEN